MEIRGRIVAVAPIERGMGQRGPWARATIIVEYEGGQYPKSIALQNSKDAENFGRLTVGLVGTFKFDCKTREFNGKWYTDINCWSWQIDQPQQAAPPTATYNGYQQGPI